MNTLSDNLIVQKVLGGEKELFGELVNRYWNTAYMLAFKKVGNREEAKDLTQDAFIQAYKHLNTLKDGARFSSWFYKLLFQLIFQRYRESKIRKTTAIHEGLKDDNAENPGGNIMLRDTIKTLPEDMQLILTLRFYRDMSCTEIAEHLGEPVGNVTSRLCRAYKLLKEKLS